MSGLSRGLPDTGAIRKWASVRFTAPRRPDMSRADARSPSTPPYASSSGPPSVRHDVRPAFFQHLPSFLNGGDRPRGSPPHPTEDRDRLAFGVRPMSDAPSMDL